MSDKDTYEALLQAVCDEPDVPLHKLALADYFGERGDELRQTAWRELSGLVPAPELSKIRESITYWWYGNHNWEDTYPITSYVERDWLEAMPQEIIGWRTCRECSDVRQAYKIAVEGYVVWKGGKKT